MTVAGRELYSSASIGISVYPDDGTTPEELVRAADAALYRAKQGGYNSFRFYAAATHARAVDRLELEHALRGAYEREEFVLYYQPIVDRFARSKRCCAGSGPTSASSGPTASFRSVRRRD